MLKTIKSWARRLWTLPDWLKLLGLAAVLRIPNLGIEKMWFDEAFTAWTTRPTTDFWGAVLGDVHPPLWPLIEAVNQRLFGFSEFMFRLPAALFGIAAVLLIWRIALALKFPQKTALWAGVLAAILPAGVYFGQDARMYGALSFFVLLALLGAVKRNWVFLIAGGIGASYTHNIGVLYFGAIGLSVLFLEWRGSKRILRPLLACAGVAGAWAPWALFALPQQMALVKNSYWVPPLDVAGVLMPYLETTVGWRIAHGLQIPAFFAVIAATLVGLISTRRWILRQGLPVLAVVFGGPLLLAGLSMVWTSVYVFRPVIVASQALCLIWAYMLNHLSVPNRRIARAVLIPALLAGLVCHYTLTLREDLQAWVQPIRDGWQPGDLVFHTDATTWINYGWYLQGLPQGVLPAPGTLITVTDRAEAAMGMQKAGLDQLVPGYYHRFWLLYSPNPYTTQAEVDQVERLKQTYHLQLIKQKGGPQKYFGDFIYLGTLPDVFAVR